MRLPISRTVVSNDTRKETSRKLDVEFQATAIFTLVVDHCHATELPKVFFITLVHLLALLRRNRIPRYSPSDRFRPVRLFLKARNTISTLHEPDHHITLLASKVKAHEVKLSECQSTCSLLQSGNPKPSSSRSVLASSLPPVSRYVFCFPNLRGVIKEGGKHNADNSNAT